MVEFDLPERSFVPEVDEIRINPYRLKQILEDMESYNKDSRLGLSRTTDGTDSEIPLKYRGRNRYWTPRTPGTGHHEVHGEYPVICIYDMDPEAIDGRILIARYVPYRAAYKDSKGNEVDAVPLQTVKQAEKSILAARLEAERQERMGKKDSKLVSEVQVNMPTLMSPNAARRRIDARLNPK